MHDISAIYYIENALCFLADFQTAFAEIVKPAKAELFNGGCSDISVEKTFCGFRLKLVMPDLIDICEHSARFFLLNIVELFHKIIAFQNFQSALESIIVI